MGRKESIVYSGQDLLGSRWPGESGAEISELPNYDAWRIEPVESLGDMSWDAAARHIVGWGIVAPSGHNKQQWLVEMDEENGIITIFPDEKSMWTISDDKLVRVASDSKGRQAHVGVGCFVENVSTALYSYGLSPKIKMIERRQENKITGGVVVDLRNLSQGRLIRSDLLALMKERRVYRGPFVDGESLNVGLVGEMKKLVEKNGLEFKVITDTKTKNALARAQMLANSAVLVIPKFREELAHHIAPNDTLETRVMPGGTFGISDENAEKVREELSSASGMMSGNFAAGFTRADQIAIETSAGVGVILAKDESFESMMLAGMVMERVWLCANNNGLAVGVMAGMVESPLHNIGLRKLLQTRKSPLAVIRFGVAKEDSWPRSPREMNVFVD